MISKCEYSQYQRGLNYVMCGNNGKYIRTM